MQLTAMQLREALGIGQAEACARVRASVGAFHLLKWPQHALEILRCDADAGIGDLDGDGFLRTRRDIEPDRAASRCELDRVRKEIGDDLQDEPLVGKRVDLALSSEEQQIDAVGFSAAAAHADASLKRL